MALEVSCGGTGAETGERLVPTALQSASRSPIDSCQPRQPNCKQDIMLYVAGSSVCYATARRQNSQVQATS